MSRRLTLTAAAAAVVPVLLSAAESGGTVAGPEPVVHRHDHTHHHADVGDPTDATALVDAADRANPGEEDDADVAAARAAQFSVSYDSDVPTSARYATNHAAALWGKIVSSPVPIVVEVSYEPLPTGKDWLASAGPRWFYRRNTTSGPYIPVALHNALSGSDIAPGDSDIRITLYDRSDFYTGTDGNVPSGKYDLVTVMMHEIGHGLGFLGTADVNPSNNYGSFDPDIYEFDLRTEDSGGTPVTSYSNPSAALGSMLRSNSVWFDGTQTRAAGGGARARLYAPGVWSPPSSIDHLEDIEYDSTRNALMTHSQSHKEVAHDPGPVTIGILRDLGWKVVSGFYGTRATEFADVTGDGRADAIAVTDNGVVVRRSDGHQFGNNERWVTTPFYGTKGTYFADMNGDGKADAIAVNDTNIGVRLSTGSTFGSNAHWLSSAFYGTRGTYFADMNGDGKADAIAVNDTNIGVRTSNGSGFNANSHWAPTAYYGTRGTFFADVTGDAKADAIVVNDGGVTVRVSTGTGLGTNQAWTSVAFYGTKGTYFADVDDDGDADGIAFNTTSGVGVRKASFNGSTGSFGTSYPWTDSAYYGARGQRMADVTGDGQADAIVINDDGVVVRRSVGNDFTANEYWTG